MFYRNKKKRRPPSENTIIKWIIIGAVVLAFAKNIGSQHNGESGDLSSSAHTTADNIKSGGMAIFSDYSSKVLPTKLITFRYDDTAAGNGSAVICGQDVTVSYKAFKEDGSPIDDAASKDKPLVFHVGDRKAMPAFEQGVIGMKPGGKRKIFSPLSMSYGIKEFARTGLDDQSMVSFDVELLEASPSLPDFTNSSYRIATTRPGNGSRNIACGEQAKINITVWDADGKKLFTNDNKPLSFTTGLSEVFLGLEQGVIGMRPGEKRTLFIPPALQKTLNGKPPTIDIPLPESQTILVDVELVP